MFRVNVQKKLASSRLNVCATGTAFNKGTQQHGVVNGAFFTKLLGNLWR